MADVSEFLSSGAWDAEKTDAFRAQFMKFLTVVKVDTKEFGEVTLSNMIFDSQQIVLNALWEGLANDVHSFAILKSRQLGISTITRALSVFWLGFFKGLKGAMIFDTGPHKEEAKIEIRNLIESLPARAGFPTIRGFNRDMLTLSNGSSLLFQSAGTKKSRGSGTLGRSSALNFLWCSEMCSWDNDEGVTSLKSSIAKEFPDRLYIWESTARGPNIWKDIWDEAVQDTLGWKTVFAGWWSHPLQKLPRGGDAFKRYSEAPLSEQEKERIRAVKDQYGWDITDEQLAWYRKTANPIGEDEFQEDDHTRQDQPWTEEEAWVLSGSSFFPSSKINEYLKLVSSRKYQGYKYYPGTDFVNCIAAWEQVYSAKDTMLKVWEPPDPEGEYVVAWDPAFGHDEDNDRSAIQVLRCYADCVEQVAEFASASTPTHQFAWAILGVMAWYRNCLMIGELNGPGEAVFKEIDDTIRFVKNGHLRSEAKGAGVADMFNNIRQFIYKRSDAMSAGGAWHWKTTSQLKVLIFERLRDHVLGGKVDISSMATLDEMKNIVRNGDRIQGEGKNKDDRVFALALACHAWTDRVRLRLSQANRTKAAWEAGRRKSVVDQIYLYNQNTLTSFFKGKEKARRMARREASKDGWRNR